MPAPQRGTMRSDTLKPPAVAPYLPRGGGVCPPVPHPGGSMSAPPEGRLTMNEQHKTMIDMDFRPTTYWAVPEAKIARIKGEIRRRAVSDSLARGDERGEVVVKGDQLGGTAPGHARATAVCPENGVNAGVLVALARQHVERRREVVLVDEQLERGHVPQVRGRVVRGRQRLTAHQCLHAVSAQSPHDSIEPVETTRRLGALLGGTLVASLSNYLSAIMPAYWQLALGILFVLAILFFKGGAAGAVERAWRHFQERRP